MGHKNNKYKAGFTIVEVVIVLAIAALIITIVLLAVSALQRSQRDRARGDAATRLISQMQNFASDNNGTFPAGVDLPAPYINRINLPEFVTGAQRNFDAAAGTIFNYELGSCNANGSINPGNGFAVSYVTESRGEAVCRSTED